MTCQLNIFVTFFYRTVLLFEHSDVVVLAALGVLFHSGGTDPSKVISVNYALLLSSVNSILYIIQSCTS